MDLFVSPTFRDALQHGSLDARWTSEPERELKAAFLVWLLREAKRDIHGYVVGERGARAIRGWNPDTPRNDAGVRNLLNQMSELLGEEAFNRDRYNRRTRYTAGRASGVSELKLPRSVRRAARYEREYGAEDRLVHVLTGRPFSAKRDGKELRLRALSAADGRRVSDTPTETAELIDYLHGRPVRAFSDRVERAIGGVLERALQEEDEDVRAATLRVARGLRVQPLPHYTTRPRTQRVVPHGDGLATAPTWVRQAVLDDCLEVDMSSAQLALVAALWDVPSVRAFLETGASFWEEVASWLLDEFPTHLYRPKRHFVRLKRLLKVAAYGVCFGMMEKNVARWRSPRALGPKDKRARERDLAFVRRVFGVGSREVGRRLLEHPLMADLLAARERRTGEVREAGRLTDVFGRTYVLGETVGKKEVTDRSALAAEAQAAEHFVMLRAARPFLDEAARATAASTLGPRVSPEAEILLWQADGFTIRVRQRERNRQWVGKADEGLQAGCRELEGLLGCPTIHTRLEVKYGP